MFHYSTIMYCRCNRSSVFCFFLSCPVSGDGEARSRRAGRLNPDPGPGTRPAHISKQRRPPHPRCLGRNLTTRPAALPASKWTPAQLPAQRQHTQLRERWVTHSLRPTCRLVKSQKGRTLPDRESHQYAISPCWWPYLCLLFSLPAAMWLLPIVGKQRNLRTDSVQN